MRLTLARALQALSFAQREPCERTIDCAKYDTQNGRTDDGRHVVAERLKSTVEKVKARGSKA